MTRKVAPIPKGYRTVTPQLVVRNAQAALAYYEDVLGAIVLSRTVAEDTGLVLQAELKIGTSVIRVMDEMPAFGIFSPLGFGGTAVGMHLYLADADEIWQRAVAAGSGILVPLADMPWGERYGKLIDPFGHVWSVSRRIAQIPASGSVEKTSQTTGFSVHEPRADNVDQTFEQVMTQQPQALGADTQAA
ncbi:VOC family protein [Nisaea sediminum]|uniref:VOC family protein n=1 Tax=Nisaea sediminum TaxID=2775867 RepID=UPI001865D4DE|nr:VOC family protein [Nisaea sediminum]